MMRGLDPIGGRERIFHALGYGLALSILTFGLPTIAQRMLDRRWTGVERSRAGTVASLVVAVLSLLAIAGIASRPRLEAFTLVIAGAAVAVLVVLCFHWWRDAWGAKRAFLPPFALALGAWLGACFWGYGMQNPAFLTKAALSQYVRTYNPAIDTFFHASMINSVKNYGAVAVGFDGLVHVPYYGVTHTFFAGLAALGGVTAIDFLNATAPVVLLPLLPASLLLFAVSATRLWPAPRSGPPRTLTAVLPWIVVLTLCVGVFPQKFAQNLFLQWRLAFHSETYGLSVSLALLWAAYLVGGISQRLVEEQVATRKDVVTLALAVLGFALVTMAKLSTGLVLLAGTSWVFLRLRLYRSFTSSAALLLGFLSVALIAVAGVPASSREAVQFVPLAFLRQFVGMDRIVPFLIGCFIWPLAYACLRAIYKPGAADKQASCRALDVEFLGVLVLAGLLPGLLFELPPKGPQSATVNSYFTDPQAWFGAALVLAFLVSEGWQSRTPRSQPRRWGIRLLTAALGMALLAPGVLPNFFREFRSVAAQYRELRTLLRDHPQWRNGSEAEILEGLSALGDTHRTSTGTSMAAYVPQAHTRYWQMRVHGCEVVPFLALSVAGIAMLDGMPPATCESANLRYYGYQYYQLRRPGDVEGVIATDSQLCERALKAGFTDVLLLDGFPDREPRRLNCPKS